MTQKTDILRIKIKFTSSSSIVIQTSTNINISAVLGDRMINLAEATHSYVATYWILVD